MKITEGEKLTGPAGSATELLNEIEPGDTPAHHTTVAAWFLNCPGQSPAWTHYLLSAMHLREIDGTPPPELAFPEATHQVNVVALDPSEDPQPTSMATWAFLRPFNVEEQLVLPSDEATQDLIRRCAEAVVNGILPAEPALAGQREPWRSTLRQTAAHARGEHDEEPDANLGSR